MQKEAFFQLQKVDPFLGIVTGVLAAEELDRDNEILDYEGSKPYFKQWSNSVYQDSKGKSYGNVRCQHDPTRVVGHLTGIRFDDANKQITCVAKITEPQTRDMLQAGDLTGFSIGGDYAKRTPVGRGVVRYIAKPAEVSVVDRPCAPSAVFSAVKADGSLELRKFAPRRSTTILRRFNRNAAVVQDWR